MDRKIELERKKAKLQAIRDEKRRKEEEKKRAAADSPKPDAPAGDLRRQTEDLLKDLGIPTESPPAAAASPAAAAAPAAGGEAAAAAPVSSLAKKKVMLTTSKVTQTNIPPRENVSYSKETQTPAQQIDKEVARHWDYYACSTTSNSPSLGNSPFHQRGSGRCDSATHHLEWDDEFMFPDAVKRRKDDDNDSLDVVGGVGVGTDPSGAAGHPHPPGAGHGRMPQAEPPKPADTPADAIASPKEEEKPVPVRELTEEEKQAAQMTEEFQRFFDRATRVVERALYEKVNLLTDYAGTDDDDQEGGLQEGEKLKLNRQFFDERWSKHRTVTCMDWSTQHPELLVASYNNNEESPHEPDGVALIWNIKYKKTTPEYIFHCQSAVMSTCFAKFHPNLLIGGTYSGQIVLWDNRSNKRTPVQRTPLSASAHTHPVYCVNVVGTQNAHNLISVSTDGKMCSWSLDMLSQPQDSIELQNKQAKPVAVTTMSFLSGDVNNFVVGSEEGVVYTACRHGSKAGVNDMFEGHMGPVTGIDCNTVPGAIDFSQYFITSSFDWTVKLWNIKENRALHSFEDNSEYVYAARWSPIHPALFATVDGAGRLDMWNLNNDTEVPTASTVVEGNVALNKALWHQSGQHIAVGDDLGKIHIYDVGENLAQPRSDEWQRFVNTLQDLKSEQAEHDDDLSKPLR